MLFSDQRRHSLSLPSMDSDGRPSNIAFLIHHLCEHVMKDTRKELFVLEDHLSVISPGDLPMGEGSWLLDLSNSAGPCCCCVSLPIAPAGKRARGRGFQSLDQSPADRNFYSDVRESWSSSTTPTGS